MISGQFEYFEESEESEEPEEYDSSELFEESQDHSILRLPRVQEQICEHLEVEEGILFLSTFKGAYCPIRFHDPISKKPLILPDLKPETAIVYRSIKEKGFSSVFQTAIAEGKVDLVKILLRFGLNLNDFDSEWPCLVFAVASGRKEIVQILLEAGANVDAATPTGYTPLEMAVYNCDQPIINLLIQAGADVRKVSATGKLMLNRVKDRCPEVISLFQ